jgi:hypothetical protein
MVYFMAASWRRWCGLRRSGLMAWRLPACNLALTPYQRDLARLLIAQNNAADAGVTLPADAALPDEIKCLELQTSSMLDAMELTLRCLLGRHAAWPQVNL